MNDKICNLDCFNCAFEDCIYDGITAAEISDSNERTRIHRAERDKTYAAHREYREANREKIAAAKREYYEANREKIAAAKREYREANREKIAAAKREYREANREKNMIIGKTLRYVRKKNGLTQRQVADYVNLSLAAISHYETGRLSFAPEIFYPIFPELRTMQ